ncbi:MAG: hypothetical protein M1426_00370 [Patescibacteria group bacterium]|nr:hypothetical protein [Patescibacteria group bacterium]
MANHELVPDITAHNMLLYGTPNPQQKEIIAAKDLNSVPPIFDVIPRTDGRPYAIFPDDVIFSSSEENKKYITERAAVLGLVIVMAMDLKSNGIFDINSPRQTQRLMQFERLIEVADDLERDLDGSFTKEQTEQEEYVRRLVQTLRHVAASWYRSEFSTDLLTKQATKGSVSGGLPQTDDVLRETDALLRKNSFYLDDIYNEVEIILHPRQKQIDPEVKKLTSQSKKRDAELESKTSSMAEEEREKIKEEILQRITQKIDKQTSGDIYAT